MTRSTPGSPKNTSCGSLSANRSGWKRFRRPNPLPYSSVNCADSVCTISVPYSARSSCSTSVRIRWPICQYITTNVELTARAVCSRADSIRPRISPSSAGMLKRLLFGPCDCSVERLAKCSIKPVVFETSGRRNNLREFRGFLLSMGKNLYQL